MHSSIVILTDGPPQKEVEGSNNRTVLVTVGMSLVFGKYKSYHFYKMMSNILIII